MRKIVVLLFCTVMLLGCSNKKRSAFQPVASGSPYEIIVVINKALWDRPAGRALHDVLNTDVPCLPQSEPNFKISSVAPEHFDSMLKPIRNVVIVDIDEQKYTQCRMSYSRNKWAAPQMVLTIKAPNEAEFASYVAENSSAVVDFFVNSELNRAILLFKETHNTQAKRAIQDLFGATLLIPTEMKATKKGDDFYWISNDGVKGRMDIVVYSVPYRKAEDLSEKRLVTVRDSVMKAHIPGSFPNTYMRTAMAIAPMCDTISVRGEFCIEMSGLWEMKGDMMGGPFISHTIVDSKNHRLITAEGFVFAPDMKKRNLIRRLQAVLYTMHLDTVTSVAEMPLDMKQED